MRYSHLFGKTNKQAPADADSANAKLLTQGGFVLKQMAGVYNFLPLGLRVLNKIQNIVREELNRIGANEILMPTLTQEESYNKTGRSAMDVLFHLAGRDDSKLVLNPTHEEVVTPLVQNYTFSYRDLPVSVYQIQNKFRNEPRAKSGLLRGREFNMNDMYSFHADDEDQGRYYALVIEAYHAIYERLGIGERTVLTYASGGMFSKYSHEFQTLSEIGEDTVFLCADCRVAVNKEITEDQQGACPKCGSSDLQEQRAVEVGNIFRLGTRFSDAFDFHYTAPTGETKQVYMGCYGIGPSRIMGVLAELFHDDKGLMWPTAVAPYAFHLVTLGNDEAVQAASEKLYREMTARGLEVLYDDRDASAGAKLADSDLIGIPTSLVMSKKTLEQQGVEIKKRNDPTASIIALDNLFSTIQPTN